MEYTAEEQAGHRGQLVEALRSGRYTQGWLALKQQREGSPETYCVMGVACEGTGLGKWKKIRSTVSSLRYDAGVKSRTWGQRMRPVFDYYGFTKRFSDELLNDNDSGMDFPWLALKVSRYEAAE